MIEEEYTIIDRCPYCGHRHYISLGGLPNIRCESCGLSFRCIQHSSQKSIFINNIKTKMDKSNEDIDELIETLNNASNGGQAKAVIINHFSSVLTSVIKNNRHKLTKEDKTEIRNCILSIAELFENSPKRKNGTRS